MTSASEKRVQVIAHRGASGYAPETTLESCRLALEMGSDSVEIDIHRLRDGTLVAMHDHDVRRTTNGKGELATLTLPELKALDAGSWFNRRNRKKAKPQYVGLKVPTLKEVLELLRNTTAGCCIEIKDPERYPPTLESELISLVYECGMERRVQILSFSASSIGKIKELDNSISTVLLLSRHRKDPVGAVRLIPADGLAIRHDLITETIVHSAHENGLSILVWTVDHEQDIRKMVALGVDGIITNYPNLV